MVTSFIKTTLFLIFGLLQKGEALEQLLLFDVNNKNIIGASKTHKPDKPQREESPFTDIELKQEVEKLYGALKEQIDYLYKNFKIQKSMSTPRYDQAYTEEQAQRILDDFMQVLPQSDQRLKQLLQGLIIYIKKLEDDKKKAGDFESGWAIEVYRRALTHRIYLLNKRRESEGKGKFMFDPAPFASWNY